MENKIKEVIDSIKPYINSDGGNIEFIKYEENIVYIKLTGACGECEYKDDTINNGLLNLLRENIPEIKDIIIVNI